MARARANPGTGPAFTGWLAAAIVALLLAGAHLLDGPDATRAAEDQHADLALARRHAHTAANLERAATRLCQLERGSDSRHHWDADGRLVCVTSHDTTKTTP